LEIHGADLFQHFCRPDKYSGPIRPMQGFNALTPRETKTAILLRVFKVSKLERWLRF
jgi:hypothetical protein